MNGYPIQLAKVQSPALRDQTLARDRLLDWLAAKINQRVVLVIADAGYGKTTLLADFGRRTRLRTLWFRLDDDDRDWISFISHLVAAGREHDPGFAPTSFAMLSDLAMGGPTLEAAVEVFLRELPSIAEQGAVLILDDFHLVDESPDIRMIARQLVARAPERLSIVFASRRAPTIPLARMRASGEVVELGTDDLRFDAAETARLFSETYGRELEPDVLADVAARTEGWAASLQLVQAALRDRSPAEIRRFVRGLTGADRELYDYLAEEVVGDLPDELQQFLMRTSILQLVSAELAEVVTGFDAAEVTRLTSAAERLTLLARPSRSARVAQRYHPLVREFLEARLRSSVPAEGIAALHHRVAEAAAALDWRVAAYHYRQAGDTHAVATTIAAAIPEIMGSGQHQLAIEEIDRVPEDARLPILNLVTSRMQLQDRDYEPAIESSYEVLQAVTPGSQASDYALLNLITLHLDAGLVVESRPFISRLRKTTLSEELRLIADGTGLLTDALTDGSIEPFSRHGKSMAERQRGKHAHYFGVTMVNLAVNAISQDRPSLALDFSIQAIDALEETSSRIELSAAYMAKANALAFIGDIRGSKEALSRAVTADEIEANHDRVDLADSFVDPDSTDSVLASVRDAGKSFPTARLVVLIQATWFYGRRQRYSEARASLAELSSERSGGLIAQASIRLATAAYVAIAEGADEGVGLARESLVMARLQAAHRWERVAELLIASCGSAAEFSQAIRAIGETTPWNVTFLADLVSRRLNELDDSALRVIANVAQRHPGRWRFVMRGLVEHASIGDGFRAAQILESIGDQSDIQRLRTYARIQRKLPGAATLGRSLARRLADRVLVDDFNRVSIQVGDRRVHGSTIRRKVLALLCFLLTRPSMSSTRDQVLDALWPELDPVDALNSLNQTVYFLRRVLEERYTEDLSPGYLHHDSDLIWLDPELVTSRSNACRTLIKSLPLHPEPVDVDSLVESYEGRFALDFEYEEWAAPYRDWLHAAYLEVVERAIKEDLDTGHFDRGISLARRSLDVDPNAEPVEVVLLKLYGASGAHAAAAEQYAHYAFSIREQLGIEPPPLDSL